MKRNYFIVPGHTNEQGVLEAGIERVTRGDEVTVHYHAMGQSCNQKCHDLEPPTESE